MKIKIKRWHPEAVLPVYACSGDAGLDMFSRESGVLEPGEQRVFHTGFALELPDGYVGIVKDKGGIAKAGVTTVGGVFDAGYRGEYNAQLLNLGREPYPVAAGDKVAQLLILPVEIVSLEEVEELSDTKRGADRFGSTGIK